MNETFMKEKPVLPLLLSMALPNVVSMLVNSLYNIVDSLFVARISEDAMTALSLVFPIQNFSNAIAIGFGIGINAMIALYLGAGDREKAETAATHGFVLSLVHGVVMMAVSIAIMPGFLRRFTQDETLIAAGITYSTIVFLFLVVNMVSLAFEKIFQAVGRMKVSMVALITGCVCNILLDPVLIFGIGPFPEMKVAGAAVATVFAQAVVTAVFIPASLRDTFLFCRVRLLKRPDTAIIRELMRIGFPTAVQSMIFSGISMVIARVISSFGDAAIAVQKVGSQIESISWMTSDGFAAAVNSFVAQNFGAGNQTRVRKGYRCAMTVVLLWGAFTTFILFVFPEPIFSIFITEPELLPMGVDYLRILAISQLFMCMEITTAGAFNGLGHTIPPAVEGILLTAARIPLALLLILTPLGLNGIWWAITISSVLKGLTLFSWFLFKIKSYLKANTASTAA